MLLHQFYPSVNDPRVCQSTGGNYDQKDQNCLFSFNNMDPKYTPSLLGQYKCKNIAHIHEYPSPDAHPQCNTWLVQNMGQIS